MSVIEAKLDALMNKLDQQPKKEPIMGEMAYMQA